MDINLIAEIIAYLIIFFAEIGFCIFLFFILCACEMIHDITKYKIIESKYKRKYRLNKPPEAKCYCEDCIYFKENKYHSKCTRGHIYEGWRTEKWHFCCQAEPRWKEKEGN